MMLIRILLIIAVGILPACSNPDQGKPIAVESKSDDFLNSFIPEPTPYMEKLAAGIATDLFGFSFGFPEVKDSWKEVIEGGHRNFPINSFSLPYIEDSTVVLTQDSLAGRPYLLAVVYADTGEQQYGYYQLLYKKYAEHGLRFVFLLYHDDEYTATWQEVKAVGFSLPGFVAKLESAQFERRLFATPRHHIGNIYLVDSEGMVIASGMHTRPLEFLYWTLDHVFDD
jgi:hypothetical protein